MIWATSSGLGEPMIVIIMIIVIIINIIIIIIIIIIPMTSNIKVN